MTTGYSETLEPFYQTTYRQAPEDNNLHYKELFLIMCLYYKQMTRQKRVVHYRVELGYNVTKEDFGRYKRVLLYPRSVMLWLAVWN